jgi:hypothetical protein
MLYRGRGRQHFLFLMATFLQGWYLLILIKIDFDRSNHCRFDNKQDQLLEFGGFESSTGPLVLVLQRAQTSSKQLLS